MSKCLNCGARFRRSMKRTPVYDDETSMFPIGYVCDPCEPAFRADALRMKLWPLEVIK